MLLDGAVGKLAEFRDEFQMYLCGFDIRGNVTEINPQTGERKQRPIKPEETVWKKYEEIFTNGYKNYFRRPKKLLNEIRTQLRL